MMRIAFILWLPVAAGAALGLQACQAKVLSPTPADQLRRQNVELAAKVESLEQQLSEARTAMATAQARHLAVAPVASADGGSGGAAAQPLSAEAVEATPHLAGIGIASSSHTDRPIRGDGCVARIYLTPVDGLGRFIQVVGTASVTLYWSPPGCQAEVISCHEVGPLALRDAYRSGFGGSHYTLEWPIELPAAGGGEGPDIPLASRWACGGPVEVKVEFIDAYSGRVFTARRALAAMAAARGERQ